jgi:hypothetical protein
MTTEGDCGAMKIVILITVIESLAVMLAIMYFYYRRSHSGKRVSGIVGGAALFSTSKLKRNGTTLSFWRANGEGKNSKIKKVDQAQRWVQFTAR